jgi:hypothetical protein
VVERTQNEAISIPMTVMKDIFHYKVFQGGQNKQPNCCRSYCQTSAVCVSHEGPFNVFTKYVDGSVRWIVRADRLQVAQSSR